MGDPSQYPPKLLKLPPNIANDPSLAQVKAKLSAELNRWMKSQHDPGIPQDTHKAIQAARQGKHIYGTAPGR